MNAVVAWDEGRTLAERFRAHAGTREHLYGHAMRGMAEDWESGGPVRAVCAGWERAPSGTALQLRLLAGVFRLVLTDQAPELVPYYPCLGGAAPPAEAWPVMRQVIGDHVAELRSALEVPPQTNEVGRSAALLAGLFDLGEAAGPRPVRLLELGASAGLNLLLDRFGFAGEGWRWGDPDSPLQFRDVIEGPLRARPIEIHSRRGCDLHPVDPASAAGRLLLTSFVWPFDLHRHERLRAALGIAAEHAATVDAASASAWLQDQLAATEPGVLPVVWHSITQLYWPPAEVNRVEELLQAYGGTHPLGRVGLEFDVLDPVNEKPTLQTTFWSGHGAEARTRRLGTAHDHGIPVRLEPLVQTRA